MRSKVNVTTSCILVALLISDASLFIVTPEKTIVYYGDDTQLNCTFQETLGDKAWFYGSTRVTRGKTIEEDTEYYGLIIKGQAYNLQVYNATPDISGEYTCLSQRNKTITSSTNLYVIDQTPKCSVSPNSTVIEGHSAVFICTIDLDEEVQGNLVWLKRGKEYYRVAGKNTTWNTKLDKTDNGAEFDCQFQYKTLPRSRWSTLSCDNKILMNVQYGPSAFINIGGKSTIVEGKSVTANCLLNDANPKENIKVTWEGPMGGVISQNEKLVLTSLKRRDSGKYTCYMSNVFFNGENGTDKATVDIEVQYLSNVSIKVFPLETVTEGDTATIHCKAQNGNPTPHRMNLLFNEDHIIHENGPNLQHTINGVTRSCSGIYQCVAVTNFYDGSQKSSSAEHKLNVHYSPKHLIPSTRYPATLNEVVNLTCKVHGFPLPTITWYVVGNMDMNDAKLSYFEEGNTFTSILSVVVRFRNYGRYACEAANDILPNCTQYMAIVYPEWFPTAIVASVLLFYAIVAFISICYIYCTTKISHKK